MCSGADGETVAGERSRMDGKDKPLPLTGFEHLFLRDTRTPEERAAAQAAERKRRKGGNRNWMLKKPEPKPPHY